jgi:hypothetical protein
VREWLCPKWELRTRETPTPQRISDTSEPIRFGSLCPPCPCQAVNVDPGIPCFSRGELSTERGKKQARDSDDKNGN